MKTLKIVAAVAAITLSASANAWWGNNGYNNNNWNNNGFGDGYGDGDFDGNFGFSMNASGSGRGRGYGNGYNGWDNRYNNYNGYGPYGYAPYGYPAYGYAPQPLTQEQIDEQRKLAEKAQKEAMERHQEMMKNAPAFQQPFQPAMFQEPAMGGFGDDTFEKEMQQRREERMKAMEQRRKEADERYQKFIQERNEARAEKKETTKS